MFDIEETMQKLDQFVEHISEIARMRAVAAYRTMTQGEEVSVTFHKRSAVAIGTELLLPFVPDAKKRKTAETPKK
jgi:hypothetical protein